MERSVFESKVEKKIILLERRSRPSTQFSIPNTKDYFAICLMLCRACVRHKASTASPCKTGPEKGRERLREHYTNDRRREAHESVPLAAVVWAAIPTRLISVRVQSNLPPTILSSGVETLYR